MSVPLCSDQKLRNHLRKHSNFPLSIMKQVSPSTDFGRPRYAYSKQHLNRAGNELLTMWRHADSKNNWLKRHEQINVRAEKHKKFGEIVLILYCKTHCWQDVFEICLKTLSMSLSIYCIKQDESWMSGTENIHKIMESL